MKYIVCGDRKIVVVDGQPFYQSSGQNSNMSGVWIPFYMIRGHNLFNLANQGMLPQRIKLNKNAISGLDVADPLLIIKQDLSDLEIPETKEDINKWCQNSNNRVIHRLALKEYLITSCRLNFDELLSASRLPEDVLLKEYGGLNAEQITLAKQPLELDAKPSLTTEDPEEVNAWLIAQGAKTVTTETFANVPSRLQTIWDSAGKRFDWDLFQKEFGPRVEQTIMLDNHFDKKLFYQAKAILLNFLSKDKPGHFSGNKKNSLHIETVILKSLKENSNIADLIADIKERLKKYLDERPESDLAIHLKFIAQLGVNQLVHDLTEMEAEEMINSTTAAHQRNRVLESLEKTVDPLTKEESARFSALKGREYELPTIVDKPQKEMKSNQNS